MSRFTIAALLACAFSAAACNNTTTTPTTPTTATSYTDTFTGTLNKNGASNFQFSVAAAGAVFATLSSVADSSVQVGLSLGTWNGVSCTIILANDNAQQGTTVSGTASGVGTLCARVYDVGKVTTPLDYQITVIHP